MRLIVEIMYRYVCYLRYETDGEMGTLNKRSMFNRVDLTRIEMIGRVQEIGEKLRDTKEVQEFDK